MPIVLLRRRLGRRPSRWSRTAGGGVEVAAEELKMQPRALVLLCVGSPTKSAASCGPLNSSEAGSSGIAGREASAVAAVPPAKAARGG